MKQVILSLAIAGIALCACVETEPVSPIPGIGFESYELGHAYDSLLDQYRLVGRLEFSFIDGDADFGIETNFDTLADDLYNYNVFISAFQKIDTNYIPVEFDTTYPPLNYRILRATPLDRVGQNKTVKGFIRIDMPFAVIPEYDTLRFDFYITDRAFNKSNVESTSDIGFKGVELPGPQL
jgi:hypothetical protein